MMNKSPLLGIEYKNFKIEPCDAPKIAKAIEDRQKIFPDIDFGRYCITAEIDFFGLTAFCVLRAGFDTIADAGVVLADIKQKQKKKKFKVSRDYEYRDDTLDAVKSADSILRSEVNDNVMMLAMYLERLVNVRADFKRGGPGPIYLKLAYKMTRNLKAMEYVVDMMAPCLEKDALS